MEIVENILRNPHSEQPDKIHPRPTFEAMKRNPVNCGNPRTFCVLAAKETETDVETVISQERAEQYQYDIPKKRQTNIQQSKLCPIVTRIPLTLLLNFTRPSKSYLEFFKLSRKFED